MKGLIPRPPMWSAFWKQEGKRHCYSTGLKIEGNKKEGGALSASASEKAAERISTTWREASKGAITYKQAIAALDAIPNLPPNVRNAAKDKVRSLAVADDAGNMPTVKEYFDNFKGDGIPQSESNRRRAFTVFMDFLGDDKNKRLDSITPDKCRAWVYDTLFNEEYGVSVGTTEKHKKGLNTAFNRAVKEQLLNINPLTNISVEKIFKANCEEGETDRNVRLPFTPEEIRLLCTVPEQPWRDMVLVSYLTGGLRLGDTACLKWSSINFDEGIIYINTKKTGKKLANPMTKALRDCLERIHKSGLDATYVFPDNARLYKSTKSTLSTEFTAMLKGLGIITKQNVKLKGKRRAIATKSFHSIRSTVVSMLRSTNSFSADITRSIVGHDSEEVERAYFTAPQDVLLSGLSHLEEQAGLKS